MMDMTVEIKDDGEKYTWLPDGETQVEINHGEILKGLLYIEEGVFIQAYSEMIQRLKFEDLAGRVDMSHSSEEMLKLHAKLSVVTPEYKMFWEQYDIKEAFYLAQTIIGYRTSDDIHAVIGEENLLLLLDLITCDIYNVALKCRSISDYGNYTPSFFKIDNYTKHFKKLLLDRKCSAELVEFCSAGRIETGFSVEDDSEIYYISALDQLVRLEIRNLMSKKSHGPQFCECEICKRLFSRSGSGSYKIVRCSYAYKTPCETVKNTKSEINRYKEKIRNRVNKHFERRTWIVEDNVGWGGRAITKINQLLEEGKTEDEVIAYMEDIWWETVRQYGEIEGVDWSQF